MGYQSEEQLIQRLKNQDYELINIPDYDTLIENFKNQFTVLNKDKLSKPLTDKEWERIKRNREANTYNIFFIDASKEFESGKN